MRTLAMFENGLQEVRSGRFLAARSAQANILLVVSCKIQSVSRRYKTRRVPGRNAEGQGEQSPRDPFPARGEAGEKYFTKHLNRLVEPDWYSATL
jgi:hypothetical protein